MSKGVKLTLSTAQRMAAATKKVEGRNVIITSRPRNPRRPRSSGGGNTAMAVIKGTVPASSSFDITGTLTDGGNVGTFGVLDAVFDPTTITSGALIVEYDDTADGALAVFKGGSPYVLPVINPSYMAFEPPSTGSPIQGNVAKYDGAEYFILPTMDPRSRPGWVAGNDQSIGHPADEMEQWEDDDLCEEE